MTCTRPTIHCGLETGLLECKFGVGVYFVCKTSVQFSGMYAFVVPWYMYVCIQETARGWSTLPPARIEWYNEAAGSHYVRSFVGSRSNFCLCE